MSEDQKTFGEHLVDHFNHEAAKAARAELKERAAVECFAQLTRFVKRKELGKNEAAYLAWELAEAFVRAGPNGEGHPPEACIPDVKTKAV